MIVDFYRYVTKQMYDLETRFHILSFNDRIKYKKCKEIYFWKEKQEGGIYF